jgi:hypothetical protein
VAIFGVIIRHRKKSRKKQRPKNEKHENEFKFDDGLGKYDDIICENEDNSYEIINYELDNCDIRVYDHINQNESKIEANNIVKYLQISQ